MYPKFGMLVADSLLSFRYVYNVLIKLFFLQTDSSRQTDQNDG